jgi:hypothetical protein
MKRLLTLVAGTMLAAVVGCESDNTVATERDVDRNPLSGDVTVKDTTYRQTDDGVVKETQTKKIDAD